jgi:hypothetical protein
MAKSWLSCIPTLLDIFLTSYIVQSILLSALKVERLRNIFLIYRASRMMSRIYCLRSFKVIIW